MEPDDHGRQGHGGITWSTPILRKKILFLCPTAWDVQNIALGKLQGQYDFSFHGSYAPEHPEHLDVLQFIEDTVDRYRGAGLDGVVSTHDYPGSILAAIVAARLRLPGPQPQKILLAQHKVHSRAIQAAACPAFTPQFFAIPCAQRSLPGEKFPFFIKPAKSVMSILACRIDNPGALEEYLAHARLHLDEFVRPFNALWQACGPPGQDASVLLGEELLEGHQVTVDGFRVRGATTIMGIVDSLMFPGTMSFRSFAYPSRLPQAVLERMSAATHAVVEALGLDHLCFNVEFFYDAARDRVAIIEVNPRMSYQFADLFEKVDGTNAYDIQLAIATGASPVFRRGAGRFQAAMSYVLRRFDDARIRRLPSAEEIDLLRRDFPDAHVHLFGQVGQRLSASNQDMQSFRYGVVNLGGDTREHAEERCRELVGRLPIELAGVHSFDHAPCAPGIG